MFKNFDKRYNNDGTCETVNYDSDHENVMNYIDEFIIKVWKKHNSISLFDVTMHVHNFLYNDVIKMMMKKDIGCLDELKVYELTNLVDGLKSNLGCYNPDFDKMFFDFSISISKYGRYDLTDLYETKYKFLVTLMSKTDVKANINDEF